MSSNNPKPANKNKVKKADSALLDKNQQRQILKRFLQITLGRLARIRLDLSEEQQLFLDALPILLHTNHAEFPCFVSEYTPCGICRYHPSGAEIQKLQGLVPGFTNPNSDNREQILGLYLSGDCGTIIESAQQNIIAWVCHSDKLAANEIFQLDRKCRLIEQWATSLNLNVTLRVVDSNFESPEQKESYRGGARKQLFLELDNLYRSGIIIAGRMPLWWIIPPKEEHRYKQYASLLMHKKFIAEEQIIDFGPIPEIPAYELNNLAATQLSNNINNPYEASLSQLLTEIYISEYPNTKVLGNQFKEAVYNDQLDLDALDPYVMVYRRIESYLNDRLERERLELIRRCFYYQVGKQLSQHTSNITWQRKQMLALVEEWGWSKETLKELDARPHWSAAKVKIEHAELNHEVMANYRYLASFARQHRNEENINTHKMNQLGKQLHAQFEHKAGKVSLINNGIAENLAEENLYIAQSKHRLKTVWTVYAEPISHRETPNTPPLSRSESLIELLSWCYFNGLIAEHTKVDILNGEHQLSSDELKQLIHAIKQSADKHKALLQPEKEAFSRPSRLMTLDVFVNVASNPIEAIKQRKSGPIGLANAFDYGTSKNNLILNMETLSINSWGEIICNHYSGNITLLNFISDYLQQMPQGSDRILPTLNIHSYCFKQGEAITTRLKELFRDLNACFHFSKLPSNTRYILQMKNQFFIIQYLGKQTNFKGARNEADLVKRLGQNQTHYSPIVFDRHALTMTALPEITTTMQENAIQVYFENKEKNVATIYVLDEKGSLMMFDKAYKDEHSLLKELESFLHSTLYRQNSAIGIEHNGVADNHFLDIPILFFRIQREKDAPPKIIAYDLISPLEQRRRTNIIATAEHTTNSKPSFNIYAGQQEFLAVDWGDELFSAVARFILAKRKSRSRHPCHISDLDLSAIKKLDGFDIQSSDYLHYKQQIEEKIDIALETA